MGEDSVLGPWRVQYRDPVDGEWKSLSKVMTIDTMDMRVPGSSKPPAMLGGGPIIIPLKVTLEMCDRRLVEHLYPRVRIRRKMTVEEYAYRQRRKEEDRLERFWRRWCQ